jgi:hypothetical protein
VLLCDYWNRLILPYGLLKWWIFCPQVFAFIITSVVCVLLFFLLFQVCFTHCCLLWVPSSCIIFCFVADVSYSCSVLLIICLIAALLCLMECLDVLCFIISVSVIMTEMPHVLSCLFLYRSRGPGGVYNCLFPVPYFIFITLQSQIIGRR